MFDVVGLPTIGFAGISDYPITMQVVNNTTGKSLYENIHYTIDWNSETITFIDGVADDEFVKVFISGIGGGNQLLTELISGANVINDEYTIPVNATEILDTVIFTNGFRLNNFTIVPIDDYTSKIVFSDTFVDDAIITITVLGVDSAHQESYYETEMFVAGGPADALFNQAYFNVDIFSGTAQSTDTFIMPDGVVDNITTRMNLVVELNGLRLRSPEGKRYIADGVIDRFDLPVTGDAGGDGSNSVQVGVADNEVVVIVDNVQLILGIDYTVSAPVDIALFNSATFGNTFFYDPVQAISRYVTLTDTPADNAVVEVYITTEAEYKFNGDQIEFTHGIVIVPDDQIAVTTYNDTFETEILTEVFRGPSVTSEQDTDAFDQAGFDVKLFDLQAGATVYVNLFRLTQNAVKANESSFDLENFDMKQWDNDKSVN